MTVCPKCKRQMNEGNSPNPGECNGREFDEDEWLCDAYAEIAKLRTERDTLEKERNACAGRMCELRLERDESVAELARQPAHFVKCELKNTSGSIDNRPELRLAYGDGFLLRLNEQDYIMIVGKPSSRATFIRVSDEVQVASTFGPDIASAAAIPLEGISIQSTVPDAPCTCSKYGDGIGLGCDSPVCRIK